METRWEVTVDVAEEGGMWSDSGDIWVIYILYTYL